MNETFKAAFKISDFLILYGAPWSKESVKSIKHMFSNLTRGTEIVAYQINYTKLLNLRKCFLLS